MPGTALEDWFLLLPRGQMTSASYERRVPETAYVCHLPPPNSIWSLSLCPSAPLRQALPGCLSCSQYSCERLTEANGRDLENWVPGALDGRFPGILNSHINPQSLFQNLLTFPLSSSFLFLSVTSLCCHCHSSSCHCERPKQFMCPISPRMSLLSSGIQLL